ncbi:MAG: lysophospholipid acyltransferase family protein, partial [Hydrogenobacter sp.]
MRNDCYPSRFSKFFLAPLCPLVKPLFRSFFRIRAYGLENVPEGSYLVAPNHRSYLDPPVLNAVFPKHLTFIAKEELFRAPILGMLLPHMSAIPIRRGSGDVQVLELALELLHAGCRLCVFP